MHNQPIGIFDSGIGGLSVYREINALLPQELVIYLGDSANVPYGALSEEIIFERSKKMTSFLLSKNAKLIVVACNTITVSCINQLREAFPEVSIIGTVPVIKTAAAQTYNGKIGVLSTTRTAKSSYQQALIKQFADGKTVISIGTDELVPLIEHDDKDELLLQLRLKDILSGFQKEDIDTLALGCTHFPFLKQQMQAILGSNVLILDSGTAIARQVKRLLDATNLLSEKDALSASYFYTTGDPVMMNRLAKKFLGSTITSREIKL